VGFLPRAAVMGFRPRRRRGLPLALDSGRGGDGFGAQKSSTRPNQLLSARDLSVRSTLGDLLYNGAGAAASIPASEHETRSSSREAVAWLREGPFCKNVGSQTPVVRALKETQSRRPVFLTFLST
jgi:hypothetical protein